MFYESVKLQKKSDWFSKWQNLKLYYKSNVICPDAKILVWKYRKHCAKRKKKTLVTSTFSLSHNDLKRVKFCVENGRFYHLPNSSPNSKILDESKLIGLADDKTNATQKLQSVLGRVENIEGKGENAGSVFKRLLIQGH